MKKRDEKAVIALVVATGISSVAGQLALIREFLTQFQGNEFVIALILFNWLVLGAAGTLLAQAAAGRGLRAGSRGLAVISLLLAAIPTTLIVVIRELHAALFVQGASVGFGATLAFTFLTLLPYCLLVGFALPYALFVLRSAIYDFPGARIYICDNLGDIGGGVLFAVLLVFALRPMSALFAANLPLLAAVLFYTCGRQRRMLLYGGAVLVLGLLAAGMGAEGLFLRHVPGRLVDWRETRYGRLTVYRQEEQVTLFEDGRPLAGSQRVSLAEELIHYPLVQIDRPRRLLLIAAPGGVMTQIAKYHLERIDYVEINPDISDLQVKFGLIRRIAGLHIIHADGRAFLKHTRRRYDAVIVCLPEPSTYRLNRYFTRRFFQQVKQHLTAGGVFSFSMPGFENYLSELQRRELSVLYSTAQGIFSHLLLLPGQKIVCVCRNGSLKTDIPALLRRRHIATDYISRYFYGNLSGQRIAELNRLVTAHAPWNTDFAPRLMRLVLSRWFAKFATSPAIFFVPAAVLMALYLWFVSSCEFVLLTSGWFDMGSEILVIFAFQIIFGYIYFQIALIVTVFLAGLLPGAWVALKRERRATRGLLVAGDGLLALLAVLFVVCLKYAGDRLPAGFFLAFGFAVSMVSPAT